MPLSDASDSPHAGFVDHIDVYLKNESFVTLARPLVRPRSNYATLICNYILKPENEGTVNNAVKQLGTKVASI